MTAEYPAVTSMLKPPRIVGDALGFIVSVSVGTPADNHCAPGMLKVDWEKIAENSTARSAIDPRTTPAGSVNVKLTEVVPSPKAMVSPVSVHWVLSALICGFALVIVNS